MDIPNWAIKLVTWGGKKLQAYRKQRIHKLYQQTLAGIISVEEFLQKMRRF